MLANVPFQKHISFELWGDISFGFPGPLPTAFELTNDLKTSKNQPDATALTEDAINWLQQQKTSKCFFAIFQIFETKKTKMANLGAILLQH